MSASRRRRGRTSTSTTCAPVGPGRPRAAMRRPKTSSSSAGSPPRGRRAGCGRRHRGRGYRRHGPPHRRRRRPRAPAAASQLRGHRSGGRLLPADGVATIPPIDCAAYSEEGTRTGGLRRAALQLPGDAGRLRPAQRVHLYAGRHEPPRSLPDDSGLCGLINTRSLDGRREMYEYLTWNNDEPNCEATKLSRSPAPSGPASGSSSLASWWWSTSASGSSASPVTR